PILGGFCSWSDDIIADCFWDTQTSGQVTSDGGTGKTTAEMKTKATFTDVDWDFETIWAICSGINDGYPCLVDVTPSCLYPRWKGNPNVAQLIYQHAERME
ncbi:unnamed protein product, partial [marine sediment metagenome]